MAFHPKRAKHPHTTIFENDNVYNRNTVELDGCSFKVVPRPLPVGWWHGKSCKPPPPPPVARGSVETDKGEVVVSIKQPGRKHYIYRADETSERSLEMHIYRALSSMVNSHIETLVAKRFPVSRYRVERCYSDDGLRLQLTVSTL